jgi:hypothetical protein
MYRRPVFLHRKLPFHEADLREFWFASTLGANSEILKEAAKMLHLYTRHLAKCVHSGDAHWRRCHCPKWIRGVLLNGTKIRRSTQTGNWEAAEKLARELENEIDPEREKIEARREFTLREAVETFLSDQRAREYRVVARQQD